VRLFENTTRRIVIYALRVAGHMRGVLGRAPACGDLLARAASPFRLHCIRFDLIFSRIKRLQETTMSCGRFFRGSDTAYMVKA
jgi:hypothetical protein